MNMITRKSGRVTETIPLDWVKQEEYERTKSRFVNTSRFVKIKGNRYKKVTRRVPLRPKTPSLNKFKPSSLLRGW